MITPEGLAEQLTPPPGTGPAYTTQLALSDRAMDLAETILDTTPRGPHQDQALTHLVRAMGAAYAGVDPAARCDPDQPVPYALVDQTSEQPHPDLHPALILDVGAWRLGLRTSRLHPLTRLAGLVLADHCGASGRIPDAQQPTMRDLSEQTGLQMQVLHAHLQDLTAHGWISRHDTTDASGGRRFLFALRLPSGRSPS